MLHHFKKVMKKKSKSIKNTTSELDSVMSNYKKLKPTEQQVDKESSILYFMRKHNVTRKQAMNIYNKMCLAEVDAAINTLIAKKLVEPDGTDKNGEPKYKLTALGAQCRNLIIE
jgi:hypothetical protein